MNRLKPFVIYGSIALVVAIGLLMGHKAARTHVNWITAVDDHPYTCWTCHVYTQKDNFIAKVMNAHWGRWESFFAPGSYSAVKLNA